VADRAGEAIERPDQQDVELVAPGVEQELIETRTLCLCPADLVGIFVDDLEATLRGEAAQIMQLGFRVLIECRNAHVQGRPLHYRRPR
jgi:hypothetical protein